MFHALRKKYPNTEFFLVRIFRYSVRIRENARKYGPEKTQYLDTFHTVMCLHNFSEKPKSGSIILNVVKGSVTTSFGQWPFSRETFIV